MIFQHIFVRTVKINSFISLFNFLKTGRHINKDMEFPPILSLAETAKKQEEYGDLEKQFKVKYSHLPKFYVRVPGRVNLIGEHIDYCGFDVLPMGIEQDIVLAVGFNSDQRINLTNLESSIFEDFSTSIHSFSICNISPKWYHYFFCGFKGILETHLVSAKGLDVAVRGTIPPSSGLSSSSALVCAAALATAYANSLSLKKLEIATLCAKAERYIGTQGGGMDQAIAFLADPGSAKLIKFNPLDAINVPLPKGANFVVANSCVPINKAATNHFNTRVVECRLAGKVLAKAYNINWKDINKLKDLPEKLGKPLKTMSLEMGDHLHTEPYTRAEICHLLEISENELESFYLSQKTQHLQKFKLFQRASHVYNEALRVKQFKEICDKNNAKTLQNLGKLMTDSHISCRDLYECSHPELDELVEISIDAGALGSRLTGAGWGGCCISLVLIENIDNFMREVKEKFYMKTSTRKNLLKSALFTTQPGDGAVTYTM